VVGIVIAGGRKPAHKRTHALQQNALSILFTSLRLTG
jgi:hypothetical protein